MGVPAAILLRWGRAAGSCPLLSLGSASLQELALLPVGRASWAARTGLACGRTRNGVKAGAEAEPEAAGVWGLPRLSHSPSVSLQ